MERTGLEDFIDETNPDELINFPEAALYMYDKLVAAPKESSTLQNSQVEKIDFKISYDPINELSSEEEIKLEAEIMPLLINKDTSEATLKEVIKKLKSAIEKWPQNSTLLNYLALAYREQADDETADKTVLELYDKFPDCLFAKVMYADLLLNQQKLDQVSEIFNGKFNLNSLYPERDTFHISEFVAFNSCMADYFFRKGDLTRAKLYNSILRKIEIPESVPLDLFLLLKIDVAIIKEMKSVLAKAKQNEQKRQELIVKLIE